MLPHPNLKTSSSKRMEMKNLLNDFLNPQSDLLNQMFWSVLHLFGVLPHVHLSLSAEWWDISVWWAHTPDCHQSFVTVIENFNLLWEHRGLKQRDDQQSCFSHDVCKHILYSLQCSHVPSNLHIHQPSTSFPVRKQLRLKVPDQTLPGQQALKWS